MFNLTDKEKLVLTYFLEFKYTNPTINVFSAEFKRTIAETMGLSNFNTVNVYMKTLKKKKALLYDSYGYKFNPIFLDIDKTDGFEVTWENFEIK